MAHASISLIITTFQEEQSIAALLDSISSQSRLPDEVIIADAGSTDHTIAKTEAYSKKLPLKILHLPFRTPRSIARNRAIQAASGAIIAISDAGCVLDPHWLSNLVGPFADATIDVVAGYYRGEWHSIFEKAQLPFVLVMPDQMGADFLPATRSMAIRKEVFLRAGMFREDLRYGEDYAFARKLQRDGVRIAQAPDAIVSWRPRSTYRSFARMLYEHAYGDAYSGTSRPKVSLIFVRYALFLLLCIGALWQPILWVVIILGVLAYLGYAALKHARYIQHWKGYLYSPLLQLCADLAVMTGTFQGKFAKKA